MTWFGSRWANMILNFPASLKIETVKRVQIIRNGNTNNVAENSTAVRTVAAVTSASGTIAYSVVAGGDGAAFTINSGSGALVFASAPDFETPTDADADNIYVVTIRATWTEESLTDDVTYYITVTNVAE